MVKKDRKEKGKKEGKYSWEKNARKDKNAEKNAERTVFIALGVLVLVLAGAVTFAALATPKSRKATTNADESAMPKAASSLADPGGQQRQQLPQKHEQQDEPALAPGAGAATSHSPLSPPTSPSPPPPPPPQSQEQQPGAREEVLVTVGIGVLTCFFVVLAWRLRFARSEAKRQLSSTRGRRQAATARAKTAAESKQQRLARAAEAKLSSDMKAKAARRAAREQAAQASAEARAAREDEKRAFKARKAAAYARRRELRAQGLLPSVAEMEAANERAREAAARVHAPVKRPVEGASSGDGAASPRQDWQPRAWTEAEDAALQRALVVYPPSYSHSDRERWRAIADALQSEVDVKIAPRECQARYQLVRSQIEQARRRRKAEGAAERQRKREEARKNKRGGGKPQKAQDDFGFDLDAVDAYEQAGDSNSDFDDEQDRNEEIWGSADSSNVIAVQERMQPELAPEHRGTCISLDLSDNMGIATLCPERLHVQLACFRCGTDWSPMLSGADAEAATSSSWCSRCSALLRATLVPCLWHDSSKKFGYLQLDCCELLDVLPSAAYVTCLACSHGNVFGPPKQGLQRGAHVEMNCFECHAKMRTHVLDIAIDLVTPCTGRDRGGRNVGRPATVPDASVDDELESELKSWRKKAKGDKTQAAIKLGTPLPLKGACTHFKKSFRWLRFPCCGRAYPCPTCHANSGCPAVRGGNAGGEDGGPFQCKRMLCGSCSFEQPITDKACVKCGFQCTPRFSAHWQGGEGSRNVAALSNKESKKFKGGQKSDTSKQKTASKKSQRVGAAAKKAREAKKVA